MTITMDRLSRNHPIANKEGMATRTTHLPGRRSQSKQWFQRHSEWTKNERMDLVGTTVAIRDRCRGIFTITIITLGMRVANMMHAKEGRYICTAGMIIIARLTLHRTIVKVLCITAESFLPSLLAGEM